MINEKTLKLLEASVEREKAKDLVIAQQNMEIIELLKEISTLKDNADTKIKLTDEKVETYKDTDVLYKGKTKREIGLTIRGLHRQVSNRDRKIEQLEELVKKLTDQLKNTNVNNNMSETEKELRIKLRNQIITSSKRAKKIERLEKEIDRLRQLNTNELEILRKDNKQLRTELIRKDTLISKLRAELKEYNELFK